MTKLNDVIARPDIWFYPGEELAEDEIRVTLMGTGAGNIITHDQKGPSMFVELGNGASFVFEAGPGSCINDNNMHVPASRMTRIFLSHLHTDHTSDLAWIYSFGPGDGDRYTPLQIWGPSGAKPELGTKANIEGIKTLTQWHRTSFAACIDVGDAYELEVTELDYRANPGIAYQENDVTITHFPALHIIDGAISYRLDWNDLSVVWTGDTKPNHFVVENAKGVDLLIHEVALTDGVDYDVADFHTPAKALGKILQLTKPRLGISCHCLIDPQEKQDFYNSVATHWEGQYIFGEDLMVFNISKERITIRKGSIHACTWPITVLKAASNTPALDLKDYQSAMFEEKALTGY